MRLFEHIKNTSVGAILARVGVQCTRLVSVFFEGIGNAAPLATTVGAFVGV
jgi:hypothetical protein